MWKLSRLCAWGALPGALVAGSLLSAVMDPASAAPPTKTRGISGVHTARLRSTEPPPPPKRDGILSLYPTGVDHRVTVNSYPQNETSIAVDRSNPLTVIGGFNDYAVRPNGYAGPGVAVSSDGGATFTHLGPFPGGPIQLLPGFDFLGGDPSVAFDSQSRAYYCFLSVSSGFFGTQNSGIFCATSNTGGASWNGTVSVSTQVVGPNGAPFEDKPMIAVDDNPTSPYRDRAYISWTRFYVGPHPSNNVNGGGDIFVARSTDRGASWTNLGRITDPAHEPLNGGSLIGQSDVQGSEPAVEKDGDAYVLYWFKGRLNCSRSTDGGTTWSVPTYPFGSGFTVADVPDPLPNETYRNNPFSNIETDPTRPNTVYVVGVDDDDTPSAADAANVFFARSTDNGATWQTRIKLNNDALNRNQSFPWMAVNAKGHIAVMWYDTRNDPGNHLLDVYSTVSTDGGVTWSPNIRVTDASFEPNTGQFQGNNFIGDYNAMAARGDRFHVLWTDTRTGGAGEQEIYADLQTDFNLALTCPPAALDLCPNKTTTLNFSFKNNGSFASQFCVTLADNLGVCSHTQQVTAQPGQTLSFPYTCTVQGPLGQSYQVQFTVASCSDATQAGTCATTVNPKIDPCLEWLSSATSPNSLYGQSAAYDKAHNRMWIFGGHDFYGLKNEVWYYTLPPDPEGWTNPWTIGAPDRINPRMRAAMAYDPMRDRLIVYGGIGDVGNSDVWQLELSNTSSGYPTWSRLSTSGAKPVSNSNIRMFYDPLGYQLVVLTSFTAVGYRGVWTLNLATYQWTKVLDAAMPSGVGENDYQAIYDSKRDRILVHGGWTPTSPPCSNGYGKRDVYAYQVHPPGSGWTLVAATATPQPPGVASGAAVYDAVSDRMLIFGGERFGCGAHNGTLNGEVWGLALGVTPAQWSLLTPSGSGPGPREMHSAIYDEMGEKMVVYGGWDGLADPGNWRLRLDVPNLQYPGNVNDLVVQRGPTTAVVTWTSPGDEGYVGTAKAGDLRYYPGYLDGGNFTSATPIFSGDPGPPGTFHCAEVQGLTQCQPYWFAVRYRNEDLWSGPCISQVGYNCGGPPEEIACAAPFSPESPSRPVETLVPATLQMAKPSPNPVFESLLIGYAIPSKLAGERLRVSVYDLLGREVRRVVDEVAQPGRFAFKWDLRSDEGNSVSRGVYYVRLRLGDEARTHTVVVMK